MRKRVFVGFVVLVCLGLVWWAKPVEVQGNPVASGPALDPVRTVVAPQDGPSFEGLPGPDVPRGAVECEVEGVGDGRPSRIVLIERDEQTMDALGSVSVRWDDGWIVFEPRNGIGYGLVEWAGYEPVAIGWIHGGCLSPIQAVRLPSGTIRGWVDGIEPGNGVWIHLDGCGTHTAVSADEEGRFEFTHFAPTDGARCEVRASRVFGTRTQTTSEEVLARWHVAVDVELVLPPVPSVGWDLLATDVGLRVAEVLDGSPAARAGIENTDHILAIDDEPFTSFGERDLDDLELPAVVTVARDGEVTEVKLLP